MVSGLTVIERRFQLSHEEQLMELVRLCHPTRRPQPVLRYLVHPTWLLVTDDDVLGYTAFNVSPDGRTMYGMDLGVHPDHRGRGLGTRLFEFRLDIARALGVALFTGACEPGNTAMVALFKRFGLEPMGMLVSGFYAEDEPPGDGMIWSAPVARTRRHRSDEPRAHPVEKRQVEQNGSPFGRAMGG
jgi:GNAT superfamily N-acetyltransferase